MRLGVCALAAASILLVANAGKAEAAADCSPVGHLPSYVAGEEPTLRDYDAFEFSVQQGSDTANVTVAGRVCKQVYTPKPGVDPMSELEIQSNYRDQLRKLGAQTLLQDDRNTVAKLVKGTAETWIKVYSQETEIDVTVVEKRPFQQTLTAPTPPDYPLLGHMPAYAPGPPERRKFDQLAFTVQQGDDTKELTIQGEKIALIYTPKPNARLASELEIQTNYRNALQQLGAEILFVDDRNTVARLERNGQSIWIKVYSQESEIDVSVIEEKAFQASIQPPNVNALKAALDQQGHVALYINFDFDKATLKPDAAPVVAQVVQLLKDNPGLKLRIEGHTDLIGTREHNQSLSEARAKAVVAAIVAAGIPADRLTAAGFGPDQPIADNETAEGRAKNRRVELVKS